MRNEMCASFIYRINLILALAGGGGAGGYGCVMVRVIGV